MITVIILTVEDISHAFSGGYDFTLFDSETPNLIPLFGIFCQRL